MALLATAALLAVSSCALALRATSGADADVAVHLWMDGGVSGQGEEGARVQLGRRSGQGLVRLQGPEGRCLSFIHIPKTAGASIEQMGLTRRALWGANDEGIRCSAEAPCPPGHRPECCCCAMPDNSTCSRWHVPPGLDAEVAAHYAECDTFCVVRDPVERFRSEHAYMGRPCSSEAFSAQWLSDAERSPFMLDCHLVPQVDYVGGRGGEPRYCKHVLRMENVTEEFHALMLTIGLRKARLIVHRHEHTCSAEVPAGVRAALHRYYAEDYAAFGFSMD